MGLMNSEKSYVWPKDSPSCHETGNVVDFPINRTISKITCPLPPILQGRIALFGVFSVGFRFSLIIVRNEKQSVVLPDLKKDLGFSDKSRILEKNPSSFHGMIHNRMFLEKSHNLNSDLMSINYVGFNFVNPERTEDFREGV